MTVSMTIVLTPQMTSTTPPNPPSWYKCAFPSPRTKVAARANSSCGVWRGGAHIAREGTRRAGAGARGARRSVTTPDSLVGRAAAILLIAIIPHPKASSGRGRAS